MNQINDLLRQSNCDLIIDTYNTRFHWYYRCVTSEDMEGFEDGFDTDLEALVAFVVWETEQFDIYMGNSEEE